MSPVCPGGEHYLCHLRELLRVSSPQAPVHRRRSPAGLHGLAADGAAALPE